MQIKFELLGIEIMFQIRKAGAKTREFDIVIDETRKAKDLAEINLDDLAQKAANMRARRLAAQTG